MKLIHKQGFPRWHSAKESAYQCRKCKRWKFGPWVRKIPAVENGNPSLVLLPGKLHGQKSLAAYSHRVTKGQTQPSNWAYSLWTNSLKNTLKLIKWSHRQSLICANLVKRIIHSYSFSCLSKRNFDVFTCKRWCLDLFHSTLSFLRSRWCN